MTSCVRSTRRAVKPVRLDEATVISRPVCPCEICPRGVAGLVSINGTQYTIEVNGELPDVGEPIIYGSRLTNAASGQVYALPASLDECSCPDHFWRRGRSE